MMSEPDWSERFADDWGRVMFLGDDVTELLMCGHDVNDLFIIPDALVAQYNDNCMRHNKDQYVIPPPETPVITPAEDAKRRQDDWSIPSAYRDLDVRALLLARCQRPDETARVQMEMDLFEAAGLVSVLRLMCFLVDHWKANGVVWGVGRGSSVASYCLFLIGLHRIDAIAYKLDIKEFLKDD